MPRSSTLRQANPSLPLIRRHGKIGICGMIDGYNGKIVPFPNFFEVISNRLEIQGFLVLDMAPKAQQVVKEIAGWIKEGKVKIDEAETVVDSTIQNVPATWQRLFRGENRGKLITKLVA